ncbi:yeats family-domain-containing protein [Diplogelasinospora grovesii]|uniref:Protein AF-9 homolog n=1 Tax=Diplogelasinospora grovesii TaxID=303347 RepID=A0AAN6NC00_9PEZI|nr:yeats family-domain-containing protein [Diplogelasinospora grovesii]
MAPPVGKRVKGVQVFRPFIYGTTAKPFDEKTNPKPAGVPDDHTHSWTVFVKGIDDVDIIYWLRRVQFKLHESIPNHVRMVEGEKGKPFIVQETGWGEFEITMKLYYVPESGEKPQTLYHHLRLHPYGRTEEEKEAMRVNGEGVISWVYEEQIFNEPYEAFYDVLTSGAMPNTTTTTTANDKRGGKGGKGGGGAKTKGGDKKEDGPKRSEGGVLEHSAMIPLLNRPGHPFSRETEQLEIKKLKDALVKVEDMTKKLADDLKKKEERLQQLKRQEAGEA